MKEAFRESFIRHVRVYDVSLAQVARTTGVSKHLLDALNQRKTGVPNVADAMKIAAFFGKTVEAFVEETKDKGRDRLPMLIEQLTAEERAVFEAQIDVLLKRRRPSP